MKVGMYYLVNVMLIYNCCHGVKTQTKFSVALTEEGDLAIQEMAAHMMSGLTGRDINCDQTEDLQLSAEVEVTVQHSQSFAA